LNKNDLDTDFIRQAVDSLPFDPDPDFVNNIVAYIGYFKSWNDKLKFSKYKSSLEIFRKLIMPSLSLSCLIEPDSSLLDIGSGPGIPGVPIKLVRSGVDLTIIESSKKALEFLSFVNTEISHKAIKIKPGRAEILAHDPDLRGKFKTSILRAFAPIPVVIEIASAYLQIDGRVIIHSSKVPRLKTSF
jgi:16S rRNA (guanine527-N7)-methyltransferase